MQKDQAVMARNIQHLVRFSLAIGLDAHGILKEACWAYGDSSFVVDTALEELRDAFERKRRAFNEKDRSTHPWLS